MIADMRRRNSDCGLVARLVKHHSNTAGQGHHDVSPSTFVLGLCIDPDALRAQVRNRGHDVIAHEGDLMPGACLKCGAFGGMDTELRGRQCEYQPAVTSIDALETKH